MYYDDTKAIPQAPESPVARFDYVLIPWQSRVSPSNPRSNIKAGDGKKWLIAAVPAQAGRAAMVESTKIVFLSFKMIENASVSFYSG